MERAPSAADGRRARALRRAEARRGAELEALAELDVRASRAAVLGALDAVRRRDAREGRRTA